MVTWLELVNVSKRYDSRKILESVNLSVMEGEIFTLLGPSGTGKSTLLKAVAGLVPIDAGAIRLRGIDITRVSMQQRNVAMVFQDYSLFPSMSIRDNVAFPLVAERVKGLGSLVKWRLAPKARQEVYREVDAVLELTRMLPHASKYPDQLSGGEQQRVAVARALVSNPDLLCLDEPFSALDKNLRQDLQQEIRELQGKLGKTILYVTHDQTEALTVSSRLAIMHDGVIQQTGAPQEVYDKPANVFVARFFGDCNILSYSGTESSGGKHSVRTAGGSILVVDTQPPLPEGEAGLRPERLRIRERPDANYPYVKGTISAVLFFGSQSKVDVRTEGGEELRAVVLADRSGPLKEGLEVYLQYDPADIFLLPRHN